MNDEQIFDMIENLNTELAEKEDRIIELEKQLAVADDTIAMMIQSKIRQITGWANKQPNQNECVSKIQSVFDNIKNTKKFPFNKKRKYECKLVNTNTYEHHGKHDILMLIKDTQRNIDVFTSPAYHICKLDKQ